MGEPSGDEASPAGADDRLMALYASPIRAGIAVLFMGGMGLFLVGLAVYSIIVNQGQLSIITYLSVLVLIGFGLFVAFPAYQFSRAIAGRLPLVTTDGVMVHRMRLGLGNTEIAWEHVGDLGLKRGLWIILLDGRIKQGRFRQSMVGAQGLWLPAFLVYGGGARTVRFINDHRPDLLGSVRDKVMPRKP